MTNEQDNLDAMLAKYKKDEQIKEKLDLLRQASLQKTIDAGKPHQQNLDIIVSSIHRNLSPESCISTYSGGGALEEADEEWLEMFNAQFLDLDGAVAIEQDPIYLITTPKGLTLELIESEFKLSSHGKAILKDGKSYETLQFIIQPALNGTFYCYFQKESGPVDLNKIKLSALAGLTGRNLAYRAGFVGLNTNRRVEDSRLRYLR